MYAFLPLLVLQIYNVENTPKKWQKCIHSSTGDIRNRIWSFFAGKIPLLTGSCRFSEARRAQRDESELWFNIVTDFSMARASNSFASFICFNQKAWVADVLSAEYVVRLNFDCVKTRTVPCFLYIQRVVQPGDNSYRWLMRQGPVLTIVTCVWSVVRRWRNIWIRIRIGVSDERASSASLFRYFYLLYFSKKYYRIINKMPPRLQRCANFHCSNSTWNPKPPQWRVANEDFFWPKSWALALLDGAALHRVCAACCLQR